MLRWWLDDGQEDGKQFVKQRAKATRHPKGETSFLRQTCDHRLGERCWNALADAADWLRLAINIKRYTCAASVELEIHRSPVAFGLFAFASGR